MSVDPDQEKGAPERATALLARAGAASARADARLKAAAIDLALPDDARLDDEVRAGIRSALARLIGVIAGDIRHRADRVLASRGKGALSTAPLIDRLVAAGLLGDPALVRELVSRAWSGIIADRLVIAAPENGQPSLLARLANGADRVTAAAATLLMAAEARRRGDGEAAGRDDLPAELHHRLVWWTAAALRGGEAADAALVAAAGRALAAHDEGARVEAAAERLAAALAPEPDDVAGLLEEALADRRLALFAALVAQALGIAAERAREAVLDPGGEALTVMLRALDLPRETIARIGFALCEADRRRDIEGFADALDAIMAITPDAARTALAGLTLPEDYRAALAALERTR